MSASSKQSKEEPPIAGHREDVGSGRVLFGGMRAFPRLLEDPPGLKIFDEHSFYPFDNANNRAADYHRLKELMTEIRAALGATAGTRDEDLPALVRGYVESDAGKALHRLLTDLAGDLCTDEVGPEMIAELFRAVAEISVLSPSARPRSLGDLSDSVRQIAMERDVWLGRLRGVRQVLSQGDDARQGSETEWARQVVEERDAAVAELGRIEVLLLRISKAIDVNPVLSQAHGEAVLRVIRESIDAALSTFPLDWSKDHDSQDNTTYEASGPYQELDGTVFYYRIHPVLRDNAVWFSTHNSDAELIPAAEAEEFRTLAEAKADCQRRHDALRAELARESNP